MRAAVFMFPLGSSVLVRVYPRLAFGESLAGRRDRTPI